MSRLALGVRAVLALTIIGAPLGTQSADRYPYARTIDFEEAPISAVTLSDEQTARDQLKSALNSIGGAVQQLESAYGTINADGSYARGSFEALKLKPSDKERLIALANGSLTDAQKRDIAYDRNLMDLLIRLTTPKELGGGGLTHLRIGDLLRFRRDPRSRETEGTDNISQHQLGKAADVLEINRAHCTESSFLGGRHDLPPFPVKVIWQGGTPYNPSQRALSTFDATARAQAAKDILGALPSDGYGEDDRTLEAILTSLERRVIADELGLDRSSLDTLVGDDFLFTLGLAVTDRALGYPTGALAGDSTEAAIRSLPESYLEDSLRLPPGSFAGDSVQASLERLGRYKAALDAGATISDVLVGRVDGLKNSPYYSYYAGAERAFGLPDGSLDGIRKNQGAAFAAIGAKLIASRLRYADSETDALIAAAKQGAVKQLSLARAGDLSKLPLNVLPVIAPAEGSSKKDGELALGQLIINQKSQTTLAGLPASVQDALKTVFPRLGDGSSRSDVGRALVAAGERGAAMRLVGARALEQVFDLPDGSLVETIRFSPPTFDRFVASVGRAAKAADRGLTGSDQAVGATFVQTTLRDSFRSLYHTGNVGLGKLTDEDIFSILSGQTTAANARAGASWVEEDLGLAPDSFSVLFGRGSARERLVAAGLATISGELFDAFHLDTDHLPDAAAIVSAIGQAKIETVLGLTAGSFTSLADLKAKNGRFDTIFARPATIDALVGLDAGATENVLAGRQKPADAAAALGQKLLPKLATDNLENKLGWDSRYAVNGNKLLAGLTGQAFSGEPRASAPDIFELLAQIGGYTSDFAFGWEPGTMARWLVSGAGERNNILISQGASGYVQSLGLKLDQPGDLLKVFKLGIGATGSGAPFGQQAVRAAVTEAMKKRLDLPGAPADQQVPASDVAALMQGKIPTVTAAIIAVNQAKQIKQSFDHAYQLYRVLAAGSSSDPDFEVKISQDGFGRYQRVLGDIAQTKLDQLKDRALDRITRGVLTAGGVLSFDVSPYSDQTLKSVSLGYFATREARNTFFYGAIDSQLARSTPGLPIDFTKNLMEGSNADRAVMIFAYLNTQATDAALNQLPENLRPVARAWLNGDISSGQVLAASPEFVVWSANLFQTTANVNLPEPAMKLLISYVAGTFDLQSFAKDPSLAVSISPDTMAQLISNELGLPDGQFAVYYQKYKQVQQLYDDYQLGDLDAGQTVFAADAILFDGKLADLTHTIDNALGLPGGSSAQLILYVITGNPAYLAQFAFGLFFGSTFDCPDLQQTAEQNVKTLIRAIIDQGENTARLIPSQIITYRQSYLTDLNADIKKNYAHCLATTGALCGVFARPEYAKQVHIGF